MRFRRCLALTRWVLGCLHSVTPNCWSAQENGSKTNSRHFGGLTPALICAFTSTYDRAEAPGLHCRRRLSGGLLVDMNSHSSEESGPPSLLPEFVIGFTGHRDLAVAAKEELGVKLRSELQKIADQFSHLPVRMVTGLAEGADTIATEIALEMGLRTLAVLPMPIAEYQKDFSGDARARLDELITHPNVDVVEMPLLGNEIPGGSPEIDRDAQYALLGDYLVRRSNILIAGWDGERIGLQGGTSDVVFRYLSDDNSQNLSEITHAGEQVEGCGNLVVWVPVERRSKASKLPTNHTTYMISNSNLDCFWLSDSVPQSIVKRWRGFDDYFEERTSGQGADLPAYGLGDNEFANKSTELAGLNDEFVRVDQIARSYQSRSHLMFALFGMLAGAMGLAFLVYAKLLADRNLLFVYIALFVAGYLGFRYTRRMHLHAKHLAYRALAETFRVQYFLILSGAGDSYNPRRLLGMVSVNEFHRFEWLQEAIRISEPVVYFGHERPENILGTVNRIWISDQLGYFEKKRHLLHIQHSRLETAKLALLVGSVIGALALIFFKKSLIHLEMMGFDGKAWLVFFMGLLPLWAAIWELYQGKMATRELLWQYANQSGFFRTAAHEIGQTTNLADGQKIIRDLADRALIEIYMWTVHRFHREHEPPAAG